MASGIYEILNLVDGKFYLGSTNNFVRRFCDHKSKLNNNVHPNIHLQRAWNKFSKEQFQFIIIEYCEKNLLTEREQYYMDKMKPEYNFCPIARSSRGRPISDETRRKLSLARIGKQPSLGRVQHSSEIEKRAMAIRGKKRSDVVKAMIGEKTSQYIRTSAHNKKLSENSTNKRSVLMIDKNTNEVINEFDSITDARIFLGKSSHAPIQKCCSGKVKTAYGYKWDYRNEGQKIIVKNQNGNLLGKYNSFTEIATMFKKSRTYIKRCFDKKVSDYEGYEYKLLN